MHCICILYNIYSDMIITDGFENLQVGVLILILIIFFLLLNNSYTNNYVYYELK